MLESDIYNAKDYFTREHIAPQSQKNWKSDIYEKSDTIHKPGNLLLLPNSITWFYQISLGKKN